MADRYQLIARKQEVRRQIERLQRELEALRAQVGRGQQRRVARLEGELERLMAEEYQLRMAIDRSPG